MNLLGFPSYRPNSIYLILFYGWVVLSGYLIYRYYQFAPIWNPNDELPHLDYIDRLANENRIPSDGEMISDRSFDFHLQLGVLNPPTFDRTKESIYPIGHSYEAHQPPLYYICMILPYKVVMGSSMQPRIKLRILRLISYLFHLAGLIMVFPVFKELRKLYPSHISPEFPYTVFLFMMITTVDLRAGINNDQMVLLPVMLSLFFMLRYYRTSTILSGFLASLFSALSVWVKFTNGLFLVFSFIVILYLAVKRNSLSFKSIRIITPFILAPFLLIMNGFLFGWDNMLNHQENKSMLMIFQPGMLDFKTFLDLQFLEFFSINYLWVFHNFHRELGLLIFVSGFTGFVISILKNRIYLPYVVSWLIIAVLYCIMFLLNKYVCCVAWFSFRLYTGYLFFFAIALLGYLAWPSKAIRSINLLLLAVLYYPAIRYLVLWD